MIKYADNLIKQEDWKKHINFIIEDIKKTTNTYNGYISSGYVEII